MKRFKDTVVRIIEKNELPLTEAAMTSKVYTPQFVGGGAIVYPANARVDKTDPAYDAIRRINTRLIELSRNAKMINAMSVMSPEDKEKIRKVYELFRPIFYMTKI